MTSLVKFFEGKRVTTIEHHGRRVWLASEIATALGYEKSDQLSTLITGHWSTEFEEDVDYVVIRDQELKEFKALIEVTPGSGVTYAPKLTLLFESGVHLAALKSTLPAGVRLRRWLAREVLPEIVATGGYDTRSLAFAREKLAFSREYAEVKKEFGLYDERSRLLAADIADNAALALSSQKSLPDGDRMVTVAQLADELGIVLKKGQVTSAGRRVASAYRKIFDREPGKRQQLIGQRPTPVFDYSYREFGSQIETVLRAMAAANVVDTGQMTMAIP